MVKCGLLSASLSAFYQSRQLQIRILPPAKVWFFAIFVLLIIASMRSYTEGVTSAGRTALLANQNLNLILAILNTLSVRSWSHPSIDHMFILRDSCLALSFFVYTCLQRLKETQNSLSLNFYTLFQFTPPKRRHASHFESHSLPTVPLKAQYEDTNMLRSFFSLTTVRAFSLQSSIININ